MERKSASPGISILAGKCQQIFLDRISFHVQLRNESPQLLHPSSYRSPMQHTAIHQYSIDVPHPLQRQRHHLLARDPQWHTVCVFFKARIPAEAPWQRRAPKKMRFLLPGNKVTMHLQSCWWGLPENASHKSLTRGHEDTCQWSLGHSEIYYGRIPKKLCDIVTRLRLCPQSQRLEAAFKMKKVGADSAHEKRCTSDNNPRIIKGEGGPIAFNGAENGDCTAVGEASSIQRP